MVESWGLGVDIMIGSSLPGQCHPDFEHYLLVLLPFLSFVIEVCTWFPWLNLLHPIDLNSLLSPLCSWLSQSEGGKYLICMIHMTPVLVLAHLVYTPKLGLPQPLREEVHRYEND